MNRLKKGHPKVCREFRLQKPSEMKQTPAKAPGNSVQENFSHEESVRGNRAWQFLRDRTIRGCQYAKPLLLGVPKKCVCANTWT